jgi:hypothetical protein
MAFGKQAVPGRRGFRRGPRPPSDDTLDDDSDGATVDPLTP